MCLSYYLWWCDRLFADEQWRERFSEESMWDQSCQLHLHCNMPSYLDNGNKGVKKPAHSFSFLLLFIYRCCSNTAEQKKQQKLRQNRLNLKNGYTENFPVPLYVAKTMLKRPSSCLRARLFVSMNVFLFFPFFLLRLFFSLLFGFSFTFRNDGIKCVVCDLNRKAYKSSRIRLSVALSDARCKWEWQIIGSLKCFVNWMWCEHGALEIYSLVG